MVPNGWKLCSLVDVTSWSSGGTPSKSNPDYWGGDVPWISAASMRGHYYSNSDLKITELAVNEKAKMAKKGTILLLVRGSMLWNKIPVGITSRRVAFNQDVKCISPKPKELDVTFLLYWFLAKENKLMGMVTGTGIGAGKLDTNDLQSLDVFLPPLSEQRKIAKILATWDKAISTTERLIDNSKQQKNALMQQLLTGKKRLINPEGYGFSKREGYAKAKLGELPNDWDVCLLSEFYWFQEGPGVRKHQFTVAGVKLFNGTNIQKSRVILSNTKTHISSGEAEGAYSHFLADEGDLVIACSGISVDRFDEKIAFIKEEHLPLCMNTSTMRFKVKNNTGACLTFLQYFMMSPLFKNQIRRQITGSAQLNFGPSHVGKCFIAMPSLAEQKKISSFLSLADNEIDILEQQLVDLKQEKKALLQQLLTGKKRVKI